MHNSSVYARTTKTVNTRYTNGILLLLYFGSQLPWRDNRVVWMDADDVVFVWINFVWLLLSLLLMSLEHVRITFGMKRNLMIIQNDERRLCHSFF